MDIFEGFRSLLHCLHRLRVEVGILERVDLHLELQACLAEAVKLGLRHLFALERSGRHCAR